MTWIGVNAVVIGRLSHKQLRYFRKQIIWKPWTHFVYVCRNSRKLRTLVTPKRLCDVGNLGGRVSYDSRIG